MHTIYITKNCNMNCTYCYEHQKTNDNMGKKNALKILRQIYSLSNEPVFIEIIGGEPLLNWPVFLDICEYKTSRPTHLSTITNGTLLSKPIIERLKKHNVLVGISYDGKSAHDYYRKDVSLNGTEQLIRKNILTALNMDLDIVINIAFHKANAKFIHDDIIDLVNLGVNKFKIHTVNNNLFKTGNRTRHTVYSNLNNLSKLLNISIDLKLDVTGSITDHYYYFNDEVKYVKSGMLGKWESVGW